MLTKCVIYRVSSWLGRAGLLCLGLLSAAVVPLLICSPANADTDPCSDPLLSSASVESTLQVDIHGVDWPSFTSIMKITVPENWRGSKGLFGNGQQQGSSLRCFMPVDQGDYQSAPPSITVDQQAHSPTVVKITNSITMTDGPEADSSWHEGLWSVVKRSWGYEITFQPKNIPAASRRGLWTIKLDCRGFNVQDPTRLPATDDGQGTLTWSFSAAPQRLLKQQQQLSVRQHQLLKQQQQLSARKQQLSEKQFELSQEGVQGKISNCRNSS